VTREYSGIVLNSLISGNASTGTVSGSAGGIGLYGGGLVENCRITGNVSDFYGGGVHCMDGGTVSGCLIANNRITRPGWDGGGVSISRGGLIARCVITDNVAPNGAGISLCGSVTDENGAVVANSLIAFNHATNYGGGVFCNVTGTVWNCTIVSNRADNLAGGIVMYGDCGLLVGNSIVQDNSDTSVTPNWRLVWSGNYHASWLYCSTAPLPPAGFRNFTNSPLFVAPSLADYHLTANSPCIDRGTNVYFLCGAMDLEGETRTFNGRPDIGAYEAVVKAVQIRADDPPQTEWNVVVGGVYQLNASTDLYSPAWRPVSAIMTATQQTITMFDTGAVGNVSFYSLRWITP
jgi:hypothetical protein